MSEQEAYFEFLLEFNIANQCPGANAPSLLDRIPHRNHPAALRSAQKIRKCLCWNIQRCVYTCPITPSTFPQRLPHCLPLKI